MAPSKKEDGLLSLMEVEETVDVPLRGRPIDPEVVAIRNELEKMLKDNTARSFRNVDTDSKEFYARKVRNAGSLKSAEHPEGIPVATRYDRDNQKLIWGPQEVLRELSRKNI